MNGSTVTWTGGRLLDRTTTAFPVRITAKVRAGTYSFAAAQAYNDNATVSWKADLSVLPASGAAAPKQHPWAAIVVVVVGRARRPSSASTSSGGAHFQSDSGTGCYGRTVIFHQFLNDDLGCACYLVGDEEAGIAVVVDPPFAIEPLLAEAEQHGLRIVRTIETHTHADHVSGHGRLALEHGIPISIHPAARVDYPNDPMVDGDAIEVGAVTLGVIHTPGHRPEHCCLTVIDTSRGDEPWLVLTGDSMFVGDAARPDLAVGAAEGAEGLYHSLHRLLELSDGVEVFPGHVAGSLCGKSMSSKPSTTIGFERRFNPTLQIGTVAAFIAESAAVSAPKPPNLTRIVETNHGPFFGALPLAQELAAPPEQAQLLDVRPASAHLAGHRPGAINVPVSGSSFATKAGIRARRHAARVRARRDGRRGTRRDPRPPGGGVLRHRRLRARRRRRAHRRRHGRRARGARRRRRRR